MRIYGAAGVGHAWLVDPLAQTLEVFRRDAGLWVLLDGFNMTRIRAEPFDAIELDLAGPLGALAWDGLLFALARWLRAAVLACDS